MRIGMEARAVPPVFLLQAQTEEERKECKTLGASWLPQYRVWATSHWDIVLDLARRTKTLLAPEFTAALQKAVDRIETWGEAADDTGLTTKQRELLWDLYPYQRAGTAQILHRRSLLLADDMGLGKTAQVAVAFRYLRGRNPGFRGLVVCPATLKDWWAQELSRWAGIDSSQVYILSGEKEDLEGKSASVTIVNYDIVAAHEARLIERPWDIVVLDEAHLCRNRSAKRTQVLFGIGRHRGLQAAKKVLLTGTPILNRPAELFQLLRWLDPIGWPNSRTFQVQFCDGHLDRYGFWNAKGSSNLELLKQRLHRTVLVRRKKEQVLKYLPPKTRQVLYVDPETEAMAPLGREYAWARSLGVNPSDDPSATYERLVSVAASFEEGAAIRHDLGVAKLPAVIRYLRIVLDQRDKVVVFAHHHDVIHGIEAAFGDEAVSLTGETPSERRSEIVARFQEDPKCKLFVGSIQAAGLGLTLTAADLAVFAELDWTPANVLQAEDRLHRIGQQNPVQIQFLVTNESLDARIVQVLVEKLQTIQQIL